MTATTCQIRCHVKLLSDPLDGETKSGVAWCNCFAAVIGTGKAGPGVEGKPDDLTLNLSAFGSVAEGLRKYGKGAEIRVRGELFQKHYRDRDGHLQSRLELQIEILQGPNDLEPVTHSEKPKPEKSTTKHAANDTYHQYRSRVGTQ